MFWFYSHPAVYIMILPGMGVINELVTCFSGKDFRLRSDRRRSIVALAVISFLVWGHHMFVAGQSIYAGMVFSILSFAVAIPSAVKVFNWTATMYRGSISYDTPMLYTFGFIGLFTIGGLTGLPLATLGRGCSSVGHLFCHRTFSLHHGGRHGTRLSGRAALLVAEDHGSYVSGGMGKFAALVIFVGFNLTFFPQFLLGYLGMPRRYYTYPEEFQVYHVLSSAGASILAAGFAIPVFYLLWSLRNGPIATANPWGAKGLEWERTTSPPITENFVETPIVTEEAYHYAPEQEPEIVGA